MPEQSYHIALVADPEIPVPPRLYGGIERIIHGLIIELKRRGHVVTLFAHRDSQTEADRFVPYKGKGQDKLSLLQNSLMVTGLAFDRPDIIHSFGRLAYLTALLPATLPKVMSYQREPTTRQIRKAMQMAAKGSLCFTGCSDYITSQIQSVAPAHTVYNSVMLQDYTYQEIVDADAPFVFLGRIEPIKGAAIAVRTALALNRRLIIAGNIPAYAQSYFDTEIAPYLDHRGISYMGPVNDVQKSQLLGTAAALLMPVQWNEPFGIVMAEALACGTPVIALKGGATNEVVIDKCNGYICADEYDFIRKAADIGSIRRASCRQDAEMRFSSTSMTAAYLHIYQKMIQTSSNV